MMDIYDNLTRIKDDTEEMSEAIKEMRSDIEKSKLILRNTSYIDPDRNQIKFNDNNLVSLLARLVRSWYGLGIDLNWV